MRHKLLAVLLLLGVVALVPVSVSAENSLATVASVSAVVPHVAISELPLPTCGGPGNPCPCDCLAPAGCKDDDDSDGFGGGDSNGGGASGSYAMIRHLLPTLLRVHSVAQDYGGCTIIGGTNDCK